MIVKTLEEIVKEVNNDYHKEKGYFLEIYPLYLAEEVAKRVRKLTIEEIANTAEVEMVDYDAHGNYIYGVDSDKILNLDLEKIQTW